MNKINNTNKYSIFSTLIITLAFVAVVFMPAKASAYTYYWYGSGTSNSENSNSNNNNYNNNTSNSYAVPAIYSISPDSMVYGSTAVKTIDITGVNFLQDSVARFNSYDRPTTYINSTHLRMNIYPADMGTVGTYIVSIYNPNNGYISNAAYLNLTNNTSAVGTVASSGNPVGDYPPANTATTAKKATTSKTAVSNTNSNLTANALGSGFMPSTFLQWILLGILILFFVFFWRMLFIAKKDKNLALKKA